MEIASHTHNVSGIQTMMHLTCTNMSRDNLLHILSCARQVGIQDLLALRGDPPHGSNQWQASTNGFNYAIDLVQLIREVHGDYFGICVAGYPQGHNEAASYEQDLHFLKQKIDAGADFVITQLFYDVDIFLKFIEDCRSIGIKCPIIPGIMPFHNYNSFQRMSRFCTIPEEITQALEPIKNDDEAVREYGLQVISDMCRKIIASGVEGLHFYTLNLEKVVTELLRKLALVPTQVHRSFPWLPAVNARRSHEDVRPIFWANRPRSYLARTMEWDEFPNGRWGDSRSPAFGALTDYHLARIHIIPEDRKEMWGKAPQNAADINEVFVKFCRGEIDALPWFDSPMALESELIQYHLIRLNQHGLLTINSQPKVNGVPSDDPVVGWGGDNGYVYQKAYVEFFAPEHLLPTLLDIFDQHSSLTYQAINAKGVCRSNCNSVNAVTWGVFPGKEVIQPTIVEAESFKVWKDEAFALWLSLWGAMYPKNSVSRRLLESIHDTYYLVNVVDNDYINGDIWSIFEQVIAAISDIKQVAGYASE
jgi:methylenetetrahydrofolate reductase (NADPH)